MVQFSRLILEQVTRGRGWVLIAVQDPVPFLKGGAYCSGLGLALVAYLDRSDWEMTGLLSTP